VFYYNALYAVLISQVPLEMFAVSTKLPPTTEVEKSTAAVLPMSAVLVSVYREVELLCTAITVPALMLTEPEAT
jgi:hypothetical protein